MAVLLKTLPLLLVHLESYPDSPVSLLFTSCTLLTGPGEFPSWAASLPPCIFTHPWKRGDSGGRPPAGLSEWACLCSEGRGTERGAVETSASPHCQKERSESPRASTSVTADGWDEARQPSSGRGVFEGFAEPERRWDPPPPPPSSKQKGPVLIEDFCIPVLCPAVCGHPVPAQHPHQACITVVAPLDGGT